MTLGSRSAQMESGQSERITDFASFLQATSLLFPSQQEPEMALTGVCEHEWI